jgi:hypothetical protein
VPLLYLKKKKKDPHGGGCGYRPFYLLCRLYYVEVKEKEELFILVFFRLGKWRTRFKKGSCHLPQLSFHQTATECVTS